MHDTGIRINGGIGFAIESPSINTTANLADQCTINDNRKFGLSTEAKERLIQSLEKARNDYSLSNNISIDINGDALANHGFGSGTAIRLSCLESLMILNGINITDTDLIRLSGRGGTSGIGVNTYFSGGLVLDLGVKKSKDIHKPSSSSMNDIPPLVMQQIEMPDWDVGICIPEKIKPITHEQEVEFFKNACPINESEAHKALYHSVIGIYSSIREADKEGFEYSIRELQKCEWKKAERKLHGIELLSMEKTLYESGANTVGMSSLGPSLFFLAKDIDLVIDVASEKLRGCTLLKSKPTNYGRNIQC